MKRLVILGATGSIGTQTLDVVRADPTRFDVLGLSAHRSWDQLVEQAIRYRPRYVTLTDTDLRGEVDPGRLPPGTTLLWGQDGVGQMTADVDTDLVVAAMVGAAGLRGTVAALEAGKPVALANKESLVVGGPLVTELARRAGQPLLPVDSEHSAIFQCLQAGRRAEVARLVLTASGGPFRKRHHDFDTITPSEALDHPTWNMGPKVTIDSATLMNKALEVIEAHWLFGMPGSQIDVVVHPQSLVHSFVEFVDGSVLAQVSPPDMRLPIQYALTYPERCDGPARRFDWSQTSRWEFEPPDHERFPALGLAWEVMQRGGTAGAALNAANEVAVERFLAGELRFPEIPRLCRGVLEAHSWERRPDLETLERVDRWARQEARCWTSTLSVSS